MAQLLGGAKELAATFDAAYFRAIHQHIFQDVYQWAGQTRAAGAFQGEKRTFAYASENEFQPRVMRYAPYTQIEQRLDAIGEQLQRENILRGHPTKDTFAERAAYYFDQFNHTHGFREGNGRTLQIAFTQLGKEAGYAVDFSRVDPRELNKARDLAMLRPAGPEHPVQNLAALAQLFKHITEPLPGPAAVAARDPQQARPVLEPSPILSMMEKLRVMQASSYEVGAGLRDIDRGDTTRGTQLVRQVNDVIFQPYRVAELGNQIRAAAREVGTHPVLSQDAELVKDTQRLAATVIVVQHVVARETFVEKAGKLAESLTSHWPKEAESLRQVAAAVEHNAPLGVENGKPVNVALGLALQSTELRNVGQELHHATKTLVELQQHPSIAQQLAVRAPGKDAGGLER
ncbi:Fic family protein [Hymenobacter sp. BT507]|uniref:protein adenylyltransferase n=1 Tax=Hymenobacter citatus TaxID=2763506 RepID=A0ABR7MMY8_9BACT|nr:Fic family protein [Hymenobacter citatus]MBC6612436.1 Fic family protein [Hymenobacter citatus]